MTTESPTSTPSSTGPTDADLARIAAASPARVVAEPLPREMRYSSLQWLAQQSGVPQLAEETPPTSPIKIRRSGGSSSSSSAEEKESEEERRARQEAFIADKNRQLQSIKDKGAAALDSDDESNAAAAAATDAAPQTPVRKPKPSAAASAAAAASPAAPFVSPEKRRAKKLSSLQYPIFSVCWWDFPPASLLRSAEAADDSREATDPSTRAIAKAAATSAAKEQKEEPSMGLVLLGGGGGKKGAGIDSGMLVCSVLPSTASVFSLGSSPIRMSTVSSSASIALHPTAFLDSNDFLIGHMMPHPTLPVIAATVGAGTAILEAEVASEASSRDPAAMLSAFAYSDMVQTDFSKDLCAQAQAWSPNGEWFVTGGEDKTMRVWSFPSLQLRAVLGSDPEGAPLKERMHRNCILSLDVNHDGSRVASCAGDGSIKIWDTSRLDLTASAAASAASEEEEESADADAVAWRSSKLVRCPFVKDVTIPAMKGCLLKFQAARFCGKQRIGPKQSSTAAVDGESKEAETEEASPEDDDALFSSAAPEFLIAIASQIRRGAGSSCLVKFRAGCAAGGDDDWTRLKQVSTGQAALTCMELSDDVAGAPLVALANTDGVVAVYDSLSLRCIKRVAKVHDLPTTALAFSPSRLSRPTIAAPKGKSRWLISASADKSVALIEIPLSAGGGSQRTIIFFALAILLLIVAIALGKEPWNLPQSDL